MEGESSWNSPWGPGRPDWNIQSSEMSMHDLNPSFDIHGGARDLIFPNHETETAQSCAACSVNNVRYWIHTDFFLNGNGSIENGSTELHKSIGDFITIRKVLRLYHPLALRFFLIDTHYQSWVHYTSKELENASDQVFNIYQALYNCEMTLSPFREKSFKDEITPSIQDCIRRFRNCFQSSMACDLHAYCVLNAIGTAMKTINIVLNSLKNNQQQPSLIQSLIALEKEVKDVLNILGLMSSSTYSEVLKQLMDIEENWVDRGPSAAADSAKEFSEK
ncbi:cysteine--tRNA ligase CPS1 homolog, chloroplastic/mitochondrial-like [Magnolia sinica]|uniref:cysteine--tRNA ligase CPS1 homolog, chloroplastic/mitochondrial-like n=1 Tax=Magnolia sinica TaxID=86752 RepID=UPI00265B6CEC|nr:cysteine--tRNA ligase CPS1 homolog, chloroplastic/mitochondrial-like [Magnolia sinica]